MTKTKSISLEQKGDKYHSKKKSKKAMQCYQKAIELDPDRPELYDKLIATHTAFIEKWTEQDFAYNVHLTMKKQEALDPAFKRINARHEPEAKKAHELIKKMLAAPDQKLETKYVEELVVLGTAALYPLIDFILGFKEAGRRQKEKKEHNKTQP